MEVLDPRARGDNEGSGSAPNIDVAEMLGGNSLKVYPEISVTCESNTGQTKTTINTNED